MVRSQGKWDHNWGEEWAGDGERRRKGLNEGKKKEKIDRKRIKTRDRERKHKESKAKRGIYLMNQEEWE